jgi:hypothetical protein
VRIPSDIEQLFTVRIVSLNVTLKLRLPKFAVFDRQSSFATVFVLVPKAAVNENYFLKSWKYNVGRTRQIGSVQAKSVT